MHDVLTAHWVTGLHGTPTVPGDKSISHRAVLLGAAAAGDTRIVGLLHADDVLRTIAAVRGLGIDVTISDDAVTVHGQGAFGLQAPDDVIDFGNSGTGARLTLGLLAGFDFPVVCTGDASLRRRPMNRVLDPLRLTGAQAYASAGGRMPLYFQGSAQPRALDYTLPVASAQVKSAVLLAGLHAIGDTLVHEPDPTRDHSERMLAAFGARIERHGGTIHLHGGARLTGMPVHVPADPSSAAFLLAAALITPDSQVSVENVCLNPLRTGLFDTLQEMGADLVLSDVREQNGEPLGTLTARSSRLSGVLVPAERAPSMIDEYPILAVIAAFAEGTTRMDGLHELRVKESDRLVATARALTAIGGRAEVDGDSLIVHGSTDLPGGARVTTHGDHRLAMAFLCAGCATRAPVSIDEAGMMATSFPGFVDLMRGMGADIR